MCGRVPVTGYRLNSVGQKIFYHDYVGVADGGDADKSKDADKVCVCVCVCVCVLRQRLGGGVGTVCVW